MFVTLTAPSFGLVHTRPLGPAAGRGAAGRVATRPCARTACGCRAARCTPTMIRASVSRCVRTASTSRARWSWNNTLGKLWRCTTIYLPRALARLSGLTQAAAAQQVRLSFVKVAEYQRRGLVHLHV